MVVNAGIACVTTRFPQDIAADSPASVVRQAERSILSALWLRRARAEGALFACTVMSSNPVSPPGLAVTLMLAVPADVAVKETSIAPVAPGASVALVGVTEPHVTPPVFEQLKLQVPVVDPVFLVANSRVPLVPTDTVVGVPPSGVMLSPPTSCVI
jgi:hypothetical protein